MLFLVRNAPWFPTREYSSDDGVVQRTNDYGVEKKPRDGPGYGGETESYPAPCALDEVESFEVGFGDVGDELSH